MNSEKIYKYQVEQEEQVAIMEFTAILKKDEDYYVALCAELDVVSQGKTIKSALRNLKEAVELYIEEMGIPKNTAIVSRFAVNDAKVA